jgi:hypothetical protein
VRTFWTELRIKVSAGIITFAAFIAPAHSRPTLMRFAESLGGVQDQINRMGRTGGLMTVRWCIDEKGARLAQKMEDAAQSAARIVRHNEGSY